VTVESSAQMTLVEGALRSRNASLDFCKDLNASFKSKLALKNEVRVGWATEFGSFKANGNAIDNNGGLSERADGWSQQEAQGETERDELHASWKSS